MDFISGNVIADLACINKVELLPWDLWGILLADPEERLGDQGLAMIDELAALVVADDFGPIRDRYLGDDSVRVPADVVSFQDGDPVKVHLAL